MGRRSPILAALPRAGSPGARGRSSITLPWLTILALLLALAAPAQALLDPRALAERARLATLLAPELRRQADALVSAFPVGASPAEWKALVQQALGPAAPLELYGAVGVMLRRDQVLLALEQRLRRLEEGRHLLQGYIAQTSYFLRHAEGGVEGPGPGPPETEARPEERAEGLYVLRLLPYPGPATSRARLEMLRREARADLARVEEALTQARHSLQDYRRTQAEWGRYVLGLWSQVSAMSDAELRQAR
ncbi:MAG TPA: hypothetical protein VNO81_13585 [Candidatus Nitrosotenuis sp.]|nr:hypothetical protein [Candidatus Nitrosotenuis sp.]